MSQLFYLLSSRHMTLIIFFVIPTLIIFYIIHYLTDKKEYISDVFLEKTQEKRLPFILSHTTSYTLEQFNYFRLIITATTIFVVLYSLIYNSSWKIINIYLAVAIVFMVFKAPFWYLKFNFYMKIKNLKTVFPYYFKSLVYLIAVYPVVPAIRLSINEAPEIIKLDLMKLVKDIEENPTSYEPYNTFINNFIDVPNLKSIFQTIYSIKDVGKSQEGKLVVQNLAKDISLHILEQNKLLEENVNEGLVMLAIVPAIAFTLVMLSHFYMYYQLL